MSRPSKPINERIQYNRDYITKSFRLDLSSKIEIQIATFLDSLPNASQFIKVMLCNTKLFEKYLKDTGEDFYGDGTRGRYGFVDK
jgi:hypothetical protein